MSEYPRMIYLTKEDYVIVANLEEYNEKAKLGYKRHWEDSEPIAVEVVKEPVKEVKKRAKRGK